MPKNGGGGEWRCGPAGRASALVARHRFVRAGLRGVDRLCRSRQRRREPHLGRPVRLPAGVGAGARQCDGDAHPVPVGEARCGHRKDPAGTHRCAHPPVGSARLLGAGRARGRRHRYRGGHRRGHRPEPAVRSAARARRAHRRARVDCAAAHPVESSAAQLRVRDRGDARRDRVRLPRGRLRVPRRLGGRCGRPRAALRGCADGAVGRQHARRHRDAACHLPALRARPRPAPRRVRRRRGEERFHASSVPAGRSRHHPRHSARPPPCTAPGDPCRRAGRPPPRRRGEHRHAPPRCLEPPRGRRHRHHPRRLRRHRRRPRPRDRHHLRGRPSRLRSRLDLGGRLRRRGDHEGSPPGAHPDPRPAGW